MTMIEEEKKPSINALFVYGSMLTGFEKSFHRPPAIEIKRGCISGKLYYADVAFAIPNPNLEGYKVYGEVLFLEPGIWEEYQANLDRVHQTSKGVYVRQEVDAIIFEETNFLTENYEVEDDIPCWAYVRTPKHLEILKKEWGWANIKKIKDGKYDWFARNPEFLIGQKHLKG